MIKTIIFDLGGVYFTDGVRICSRLLSKKYNISEEIIKEALLGEVADKYRVNAITRNEFCHYLNKILKIGDRCKDFEEDWFSCYTPNHGTINVINKLREDGYEILYLTDNIKNRFDYLQNKYGFKNSFKAGISSHDVCCRKPDRLIYDKTMELTKSKPNECIFIDDKEINLIPAKEMGMKTIHFKGSDLLLEQIKKLGVEI